MTTQEAIQAIISYETLPPQIDYRVPQKLAANEAHEFLNTLPTIERDKCYVLIDMEVSKYYDDSDGPSPAYLDSLF